MTPLKGWRLGWVGVGRMGTPLCRRLLDAGAILWVADTDPARLAALEGAGARPAANVRTLVAEADVILSMVPDDNALLSVASELAEEAGDGKVFIDLSTVSPSASAQVAEMMRAKGIDYLRCPVSGSTSTAAAGALTLFLSGPAAVIDRCVPILAALGKETLRCGPAEEARAMKLMVNLAVAMTPALLGEALAFGGKLGLEWNAMVDAFSRSVVASPLLSYKIDMLKARDWRPAADIDLVAKDVDLALSAGAEAGVHMPLTALARQFAAAHQASGEGKLDFFRVVTWPEQLSAAKAPGEEEVQETIRALETRRYAAMKAGDVAALRSLMSERLVYVHSDATQDSRESYLGTLAEGRLRYREISFETKEVLQAGSDTAIALGSMSAEIIRNGTDKSIASMTCAVWTRENEHWTLLAYQPTALPKP